MYIYIDTSAWSPKYYEPEFITFANTTGKKKVMFGTNFPQLGLKYCVNRVNDYLVGTKGGFIEGVVKGFMGGNALRVLKLPLNDMGGHGPNLRWIYYIATTISIDL